MLTHRTNNSLPTRASHPFSSSGTTLLRITLPTSNQGVQSMSDADLEMMYHLVLKHMTNIQGLRQPL